MYAKKFQKSKQLLEGLHIYNVGSKEQENIEAVEEQSIVKNSKAKLGKRMFSTKFLQPVLITCLKYPCEVLNLNIQPDSCLI